MIIPALISHSFYLPGCAAATVLLLLFLIARLRLHPALALCIGAMFLGGIAGMPPERIPAAFASGVGNLLGHVAVVLMLGAVLGRLLAESGGASALGQFLVDRCGERGLPWALLATGLLVGTPVFFEVGLVLLLPIVASAARQSGRPAILVALPVLAGLSIVHAVFPPHPAAMLAVVQFHADPGRTMLFGALVGMPAAALAGPILSFALQLFWPRKSLEPPFDADLVEERFAPAAGPLRAAVAILLPVLLIFAGSWADHLMAAGSFGNRLLHALGAPDWAMLIAVLAAMLLLGPYLPRDLEGRHLYRLTEAAFVPIAGVLAVLSAAGGLSGILRDSGVAQATVSLALGAHMSPLVLAWMLAAVVRLAMGSSTVAMAVASGVMAPMTAQMVVRPELLVLATGTGSIILSHLNDPGFWMIQSFFKTELKETLASWSVLETILSLAGLGMTLLISRFIV